MHEMPASYKTDCKITDRLKAQCEAALASFVGDCVSINGVEKVSKADLVSIIRYCDIFVTPALFHTGGEPVGVVASVFERAGLW